MKKLKENGIIVMVALILLISFGSFYPKYYFIQPREGQLIKCNRITGTCYINEASNNNISEYSGKVLIK